MSAVTLFNIILLISASLLCIALIIYIYKISKSIKEIQVDIKDISIQIKPLIASTTNLSEKLNYLSEKAKSQVGVVEDIVSDVKYHVNSILALEEKVRRGIEEPVSGVIKNLSAVVNGVNTFWNAYKKR